MIKEYIFENVKDFDLRHIFECGQCFRWNRQPDGSYSGQAWGRPANVSMDGSRVRVRALEKNGENGERFWREYFDLDRDYGSIKRILAEKDPVVAEAIKSGEGIRILHQEPWETIVSFIISSNNNIPRIKGCIERLAGLCGTFCGEFEGKAVYNVPTAEVLAKLEPGDLATAGLGYRAAYLVKTARQVIASGDSFPPLRSLAGVGPKVESCIRLFGFGDLSSFPIDVWVRRVMSELYGFDEGDISGMQKFAADTFGPYGGIAQQYLFYYMREAAKQ